MPFPRRKNYIENYTPMLYKKSVTKTKNGRYLEKDVSFDKCKPLPSADMYDLTAVIASGNDAKLTPLNCEIKNSQMDFGYKSEPEENPESTNE